MAHCDTPLISDWLELIAVLFGFLGVRFAYKQLIGSIEDQEENIKALASVLERQERQIALLADVAEESKVQTKKLFEIQQVNEEFLNRFLLSMSIDAKVKEEQIEKQRKRRIIEIRPEFARPKQGIVGGSRHGQGWELFFINYGGKATIESITALPDENESTIDPIDPNLEIENEERLTITGAGTRTNHNGIVQHTSTKTGFEIIFTDVDGNRYKQVYRAPTGIQHTSSMSKPEPI